MIKKWKNSINILTGSKKNIKYLDVFYEFPLNEEKVLNIVQSSDLDKLDALAYRLIKFQDALGRVIKLFLH
ncbi:hypothetical protein [Caminibacter sp.]